MNQDSKQNKRRPNFSTSELEALVNGAHKYRDELKDMSNSEKAKQRKENTWNIIANKINATSAIGRIVEEAKIK